MADFGLTEQGFILKRLEDILTTSRQNAVAIFQDLLEPGDTVDTSDSSTLGRLINLVAPSDAILWEQAQLAGSSLDPNTAMGIALDNVVQYGGITRESSSYSTATGLFTGTNGTEIPIDSVVGAATHPNTFRLSSPVALTPTLASGVILNISTVVNSAAYTLNYSVGSVSTNTVTYNSDSSATEEEILAGLKAVIDSVHPTLSAQVVGNTLVVNKVEVFQTSNFSTSSNLSITSVKKLGSLQAEEVGVKSAEANSLTVIKTPVLGWESVTNPLGATEGSLKETDEELRLRFRNTKFERSSNILDSLYSALANLPGVDNVTVYENDQDVTDANGLPPHSFTVVILGGDSEEIAETIWKNKPAGIGPNGNTSVEVIDSQGFTHTMKFVRPNPVTIHIAINLTTGEQYPGDGADLIRSAIIEYAKENFGVGEDVIFSRLYTPVNTVIGHQVNSMTIGTIDPPVGTSNIAIPFDQIASFESVNIDITTTG